ncbi:MAG: YitT family protein [Eubacteriales bacterium]|nr:YitT family protein [Eubacteriales bacterium]
MVNKKVLRSWKDYIWIFLGCALTALAINIFLVPYRIAPGGVTGIATVIYYAINKVIPVGIIMLLLNLPLFLSGYKYIGRRFFVRTFFATIVLSLIVDLGKPLTDSFVQNYLTVTEFTSDPDILLYSIFGGGLMGVGLGLVFKFGATTGGTDLAARVVKHFAPSHTMGQLIMMIDSFVVVVAAIFFKSFQLGLYAIVALFVSAKVVDAILEGINFAKALFIISDKSEEIAKRIMAEMDRGVTGLKGTGMYTGMERQVLFCVVQRGQLQHLKRIVKSIDKDAFLILTDAREVLGEGFGNDDGM